MTDLFTEVRTHPHLLDRAFRAADRSGEAALNGLLYVGSALMASAVLLVTTTPAVLATVLATVPWLVLAFAGWWWISPSLRDEMRAERQRLGHLDEARMVAVELLLRDEEASLGDRRVAAAYLLETIDGEERDSMAARLQRLGE